MIINLVLVRKDQRYVFKGIASVKSTRKKKTNKQKDDIYSKLSWSKMLTATDHAKVLGFQNG